MLNNVSDRNAAKAVY